jgi:hypothetical protein
MKKILLALFLSTSFSAVASPVFLWPNCSFAMSNGQCTLVNNTGKDINCNIQITGRTQQYRSINAFEYRFLYSGMMAWVNVTNYYPNDPIVFLQGTANCNTVD